MHAKCLTTNERIKIEIVKEILSENLFNIEGVLNELEKISNN